MKQHDLIQALEETYPDTFEVAVHFKHREVTVSEKKGLWDYALDYEMFQAIPAVKLAREVVYAYENRR